jgi:hypothetical protein
MRKSLHPRSPTPGFRGGSAGPWLLCNNHMVRYGYDHLVRHTPGCRYGDAGRAFTAPQPTRAAESGRNRLERVSATDLCDPGSERADHRQDFVSGLCTAAFGWQSHPYSLWVLKLEVGWLKRPQNKIEATCCAQFWRALPGRIAQPPPNLPN